MADPEVTVTHEVSGADYEDVAAGDVTVTITETGTPGVTVSPTELTVTEGETGEYTVVLTAAPSGGAVTVTPRVPADTDVTVSPATLTFTAEDWDQEQTLTVEAAADPDAATDPEVTVTHEVSGADYEDVAAGDVTVTITETGTPGVTVSPTELTVTEGETGEYTAVLSAAPSGGAVTVTPRVPADTDVTVSPATLTFTAEDWDQEQTLTVEAAADPDAVADDAVTVTHEVTGADYEDVAAGDVTVTITETGTPGVTVSPTELTVTEGETGEYTVVLTAAPSGGAVTVTPQVPADTDVTVSPAALTFTAEDWDQEQTLTVEAAADPDAATDPEVTLTHEVTGADYELVTAADVTVTITETGTPGVTVSPTELTVTEGETGEYTAVLSAAPSGGDVTVTPRVPADTDVTVSPATLTFTAEDWDQEQTLTVEAAADPDAATDPEVTVTHEVSGADYEDVAAGDVTVTITETDTPAVTVTPTVLHVGEGNSVDYTMVLATEPSADVTIAVSGHAGTDLRLLVESLTFTAANWSMAQTVTVRADDDDDAAPDASVTLTHAVSGGDYAAVGADSVTVTIYENDPVIPPNLGDPNNIITYPPPPGVTVEPAELTISEGGSAGYVVGLTAAPSSTVTVAVDVPDSDATAAPESLQFTADNWTTGQTVTVTAGQDDDAVDDAAGISHDFTGGGYSITGAATVVVTIDDDDTAGVTVTPAELTVPEGETGEYTAVLTAAPSGGDVTVTPRVPADTDVTVRPAALTFTAADWDQEQRLTVEAAADPDAATDPEVTVTHDVSGADYEDVAAGDVTVTITEDDTPILTVADAGASEGDQNPAVAFEVTLSTMSSNEVTVIYATSDGTALAGRDYAATSGTLTFPARSTASQTIRVPVIDDAADEAEAETFTLTLSAAQGAILAGGQDTLAVTGTIDDDDDPEVTASFGAATYSVVEGAAVSVTVTLSPDPEREVTIPLTVTPDGGTTSADYGGVPASVVFASGDTERSFTVSATDDQVDDAGKRVILSFDDDDLPERVTAGTIDTSVVSIDDNDVAPELSIADATLEEADADLQLTVSLHNAAAPELGSGRPVTVAYTVADVTAEAGTDYTPVAAGTLTFAPGETGKTIAVPVLDDDLNEADETLTVTLSPPADPATPLHATLTDATATATITDDDTLTAAVTAATPAVTEGDQAPFPVALTGGTSTAPVAVTYTIGGSATPGDDYTVPSGTLTLAAGAASGTIVILTTPDEVLDPSETLVVTLSAARTAGTATVETRRRRRPRSPTRARRRW